MTYTKLFSSITESTIWMEDKDTRLVWICMMAMADKHGRVYGSIPGIANRARVDLKDCETALTKFLSPDQYSRTKDHEGRRIQVIEGGWRLINHGYYRNLQDTESQKAYKAAWAREKRKREKDAKALGVDVNVDNKSKSRTKSTGVDDIAEASPSPEAKTDKLTKARAKSEQEVIDFCSDIELPQSDGNATWLKWEANGWMNGGAKIKDWKGTIRAWKAAGYMPSQKQNYGQRNNHSGRGNQEAGNRSKSAEVDSGAIKLRVLNGPSAGQA